MTTDIIQLTVCQRRYEVACIQGRHTKPSFVTSVEAKPPGVSLESTIIHDGPFLSWSVELQHGWAQD